MLKLKNIKICDDLIEADYFPESDSRSAHVSLDVATGAEKTEIIDEYGGNYARMALNGLRRILEDIRQGKEICNERIVMWY